MEHFSHKHPLIEVEEHKGDISCNGCSERILFGPFYSCTHNGSLSSSCKFNLHKFCAEQPQEIQHPMHPDHPLTLRVRINSGECCYNCRILLKNFTYHCSLCKFDLHMSCALRLKHNIESTTTTSTHPLIPLLRSAFLLCEACGTRHNNNNNNNDNGFFYTCSTCIQSPVQFFIHKDCVSLPSTIKLSGHDHLLNLAYSVPPDYSQFHPNCDICSKRLDLCYWIYYCGGCRYFAHVYCAKSNAELLEEPGGKTEIEDFDQNVIHLPVNDEYVSLVSHFLKELRLRDNEREKITELDHFSHEHPLILFDVQTKDELCSGSKLYLTNDTKKNVKICNGCVQPISINAPFYSCAQCNFFLHKWCAELPTELQLPSHPQHPLILAKGSKSLGWFYCDSCESKSNGFDFRCEYCKRQCNGSAIPCDSCERQCNGFVFHCASCKLIVDIKCGLVPSAITHEAHPQHLLVLKVGFNERGWCNACDLPNPYGFAFECNTCNFKMDTECSLLLRTIRHRYDKHPFILTYSPVKDHPLEYICEICEQELDPKLWFYHCVECDQSIHRACI